MVYRMGLFVIGLPYWNRINNSIATSSNVIKISSNMKRLQSARSRV